MIVEDKVIVMDIDGTLCGNKDINQSYLDIKPIDSVLNKMIAYRDKGFHIILHSSRQMRTYKGNQGLITANTGKVLFEWLEKYNIPFDEIYLGKPWCGKDGFYVDDKAIRPNEFVELEYNDIMKIINPDREVGQ